MCRAGSDDINNWRQKDMLSTPPTVVLTFPSDHGDYQVSIQVPVLSSALVGLIVLSPRDG